MREPESGNCRRVSRRKLLQAAGASMTAIVAGCLGDGDDDGEETPTPTDSPGPTPTESESMTPTPTATATSTETPAQDELDPEQLKGRAQEFVSMLADGEFEAAHGRFSPSTADQISVERLSAAWQGRVGEKGALVEFITSEYQGTQNGAEIVVVGAQFENGRQEFNFAFDENGIVTFVIPEMETEEWSPPSYADQSTFTEQELTLDAPGNCSLGATLSLPDGEEPVPGVVLVHGNGAQDRDETVGPNKTFKELAWGLASRGIAVLRYDKRTLACDVDLANVTIDDVATDDALTAIERLRSHGRIAADGVFVAGHSFGGVMAPRIAARDGNLAGVVMLAPGPARSIADTIVDQQRHLLSVDGELSERDEARLEEVRAIAEKIRTLDIDDNEVVSGFGGRQYYRTLQEYDHLETAAELGVPRFVAQGGRDWQVTIEDDLALWRDAFGDDPNVRIEVYETLNHRFQESEPPLTGQEYSDPDAVFAERVVADVAEFVKGHS